MGKLQHNKMIIVDGPTVKKAIGGSTNFSWRGFYVQANNAVVIEGATAIAPFKAAFDAYWASDEPDAFGVTGSAVWNDLRLPGIDGRVTFSPHGKDNAILDVIAKDIGTRAKSSILYSLAFLYQTDGPIRDAIRAVTPRADLFIYGISDKKVGGHRPAQAGWQPRTGSTGCLVEERPPTLFGRAERRRRDADASQVRGHRLR